MEISYHYCLSPSVYACGGRCNDCSSHPQKPKELHVLVGVTASVATIKLAELVNYLCSNPCVVEVAVMATEKSEKFFDAEEIKSIGEKHDKPEVKIWRDSDEWEMWNERGDPVLHIDLGKWADALILAPLDANTLAKISHGICDNLLTCVLRAWDTKSKKPVIFCPAMNTKMWNHPLTKIQIQSLQTFGYTCVQPIQKTLMCGDTGMGAMATVDTIVKTLIDTIEDQSGSGSHSNSSNSDSGVAYLQFCNNDNQYRCQQHQHNHAQNCSRCNTMRQCQQHQQQGNHKYIYSNPMNSSRDMNWEVISFQQHNRSGTM